MAALPVLNNLPFSKVQQQKFAEQAIDEILSGDVDPLSVDIRLKAMLDTIEKIRKNDRVKDYVLDEAEKQGGKTFDFQGAKITLGSKTTRDYTGCGDTTLNEMYKQMEKLKEQIKVREAMVLTGVNQDTGEIYNPPQTSTSRFLTYKFI